MSSVEARSPGKEQTKNWTAGNLAPTLLILAATLVLMANFRPLIDGTTWWFAPAVVSAIVLFATSVARGFHFRVPSVVGLAALLFGISMHFASWTLLGVLPTLHTFGALGTLWSEAWELIRVEQIPIPPAESIIFLMAAAFGLIALALEVLVNRFHRPILGGIVIAVAYVLPSAIAGGDSSPWAFAGLAAIWLLLVHGEHSTSNFGGGAMASLVAGAAIVIGVILPPALPNVPPISLQWGASSVGAFDRGINPILELGQNLRSNSDITMAKYTTTSSDPLYLKVAELRDFNGKTWKPDPVGDYGHLEGSANLGSDVKKRNVTTKIQIVNLRSNRLPLPYPSLEVTGLEGSWRWEQQGQTLVTSSSDAQDQHYTVTSLERLPTQPQLRRSGPSTVTKSQDIQLPKNTPRILSDTARRVTNGQKNNYDRARALQNYFRNGDFTYSETAPVAQGYDGSGVDVLARFLKKKSGYCIHFASAMAVMARSLHIPARIAVGFAPGTAGGITDKGKTIYEVTSDDLHAWPELYFTNVGWVGFDPTPGVGDETGFSEPITRRDVTDQYRQLQIQPRKVQKDLDVSPKATAPQRVATVFHWQRTALPVGIFVLLMAPMAIRRGQRRWRLRPAGRSANSLWRELECTAIDFGIIAFDEQTPRQFAHRLAEATDIDPEALRNLLDVIESARFGQLETDPNIPVDDVRLACRTLGRHMNRRQRFIATFAPRSLLSRLRSEGRRDQLLSRAE